MIKAKLDKFVWYAERVRRAEERLATRGLFKASGFIRIVAKRSIRKRKKPSRPGSPPHTQTGKLRRAIRFDVDRIRMESLIGPDAAIVGESAGAHEHGGNYKGDHYEQRAFMGPALEKSSDKTAQFFAGEFK